MYESMFSISSSDCMDADDEYFDSIEEALEYCKVHEIIDYRIFEERMVLDHTRELPQILGPFPPITSGVRVFYWDPNANPQP